MVIYTFGVASPWYWAEVVNRQALRIRELQNKLAGYLHDARAHQAPIPEAHGQDARLSIPHLMGIDAHFLVYAADHALTICSRFRRLSNNNPVISRALTAFTANFAHLPDVRDLLAHFEDHVIGQGRRPIAGQLGVPLDNHPHICFDEGDVELRGEVTFGMPGRAVPVYELAEGVTELVRVANGEWDLYTAKG